ncbi:MOSC domain-containing protein [Thalassotalea sp. PS06]|uniref:MOSC domain-containing protein n=1 Tax=Thalassotalea sp. PS06 TaxID=2594005 RepID=UPI0011632B2B|nr:MOSC domain-containing protein [Thalassotalea sp. PS06]QDP02462.1 MOSC domain-containing protein [Thalassotalea sp. PS06]
MRSFVRDLFVYPIKSAKGVRIEHSNVQECGLAFDRHFLVTDTQGKFITGRSKAKMVLIETHLHANGILLEAPGMGRLVLQHLDFTDTYDQVQVWNDKFKGQHCSESADKWLSQYLGVDCRLYYFGPNSVRHVTDTTHPVSFADGYPILLLSQASLRDLNQRATQPIVMEQFRPNIVVDRCSPYAEDTWHKIRIGDVEFLVSKPCSRCVFTTVDPITGKRSETKEPLATLNQYRCGDDGQIYFGQNLIPLNSGHINIGDQVEILSSQPPLF